MSARANALTASGALMCEDAAGCPVWRVGYAPDPWTWTPWQYAEAGRFSGRWDDPHGIWRSVYVGQSALACYLEVLAPFRPDPRLAAELASVKEDPIDAIEAPTLGGGLLPREWCEPRMAGKAHLYGWYVLPSDVESLPTLRTRFLRFAADYGLPDVDAAAIRQAEPRAFTQAIAAWIYDQDGPDGVPVAGVGFDSRHGDGLGLWAVFERPGDGNTSQCIAVVEHEPVQPDDPHIVDAMRIHRLQWSS